MDEIKYKHDRLRYGDFPVDALTDIPGITVDKESTEKRFIDLYIIKIDNKDVNVKIQDIAFQIGMLVQNEIILKQ